MKIVTKYFLCVCMCMYICVICICVQRYTGVLINACMCEGLGTQGVSPFLSFHIPPASYLLTNDYSDSLERNDWLGWGSRPETHMFCLHQCWLHICFALPCFYMVTRDVSLGSYAFYVFKSCKTQVTGWMCVYHTCFWSPWRSDEVTRNLKLEFHVLLSFLVWVLGTESQSSIRIAYVLHY